MTDLGLSETQFTDFYDTSVQDSFGTLIKNMTQGAAEWFTCWKLRGETSRTNCTGI